MAVIPVLDTKSITANQAVFYKKRRMKNKEVLGLLRENKVSIAHEDDRSPIEIAVSLGLVATQNEVEIPEQPSGIIETNG